MTSPIGRRRPQRPTQPPPVKPNGNIARIAASLSPLKRFEYVHKSIKILKSEFAPKDMHILEKLDAEGNVREVIVTLLRPDRGGDE